MTHIRLTTAGESHGPAELCILEGVPSDLALTADDIDIQLARRQKGYGRGGRMAVETDRCEILAGVRLGKTIGSPIALFVENKDHASWTASMGVAPKSDGEPDVEGTTVPRPGHADYAGVLKYGHSEIRPVLERASARETVSRVAGGAVCRRFLEEVGVTVRARVVSIGAVSVPSEKIDYARPETVDWLAVEASEVRVDDPASAEAMCAAVDSARAEGESLGGVLEVWAWTTCPGLGSNASADMRMDARLFAALGSIPAIKGVELGCAFDNATLVGSEVHDEFKLVQSAAGSRVARKTNRAGGVEGGMTNGMPIVIRAAMKPIPTLTTPLASVDLATMTASAAHVERSDVMAVPAAAVVAEAMTCIVLADAYLEKFGGDSLTEVTRRVDEYVAGLEERGLWRRS